MTWFDQFVKPVLDTITAVGTLIALIALVVTVFKNKRDKEVVEQQELLEQCKRTLEWAYTVLVPDPTNDTVPANRLNWLTAARHILAYQALKKEITLKVQLRICEDFEEFWRHRFYLALSDEVMSTAHYWASQGKYGANIETKSALVIVDFSEWPDGKVDSTAAVDPELLKGRNGLKGNAGRGLKDYFEILHKQAADRESRREAKAAQIDQN